MGNTLGSSVRLDDDDHRGVVQRRLRRLVRLFYRRSTVATGGISSRRVGPIIESHPDVLLGIREPILADDVRRDSPAAYGKVCTTLSLPLACDACVLLALGQCDVLDQLYLGPRFQGTSIPPLSASPPTTLGDLSDPAANISFAVGTLRSSTTASRRRSWHFSVGHYCYPAAKLFFDREPTAVI